jgi:hypothetical protein
MNGAPVCPNEYVFTTDDTGQQGHRMLQKVKKDVRQEIRAVYPLLSS